MRKMLEKHVNTKLFFINIITAVLLNFFLEYMERKSMAAVWSFIDERSFMFCYNTLIIFMILSPVFLVKKKYFAYVMTGGMCFLIGLANGIILNNRNTPFTAVDLTIAKSTLPILSNYFKSWQIILGIVALIVGVFLLVCLYLYSPEYRKEYNIKRGISIVALFAIVLLCATFYGKKSNILHKRFDNLIIGYKEYGVAYSFVVTFCDTGIDRPIEYSKDYIYHLEKKVDKKWSKNKTQGKPSPNIIFIQLESFFDITKVKGLSFSEDPLPVLHQLQNEYISGKLSVPVYGAGTINTEFEAITGMNTDYFGTGEYPYRSILHKTQCDSMAYWMHDNNYIATVVHNNNASFYDRDTVFRNLGFDYFISSENMYIKEFNDAGWSRDAVLTEQIENILTRTPEKDYIYTISVQGHGDYPEIEVENPAVEVYNDEDDENHKNQVIYYTNQIHEMDEFIGNLTDSLKDWPEDVILVFYGDHLPGLGYESADLKEGTKYQTPYVIWDNFGYSRQEKEKLSADVQAWELASKVLAMTAVNDGVLNRYQQTMKNSKKYKKNQKMLQYDLLYGSRFSLEKEGRRQPTDLKLSMKEIRIHQMKSYEDGYFIWGEGFTSASRVYVNDIPVKSHVASDKMIYVENAAFDEDDEIVIHQVSKTNENKTLCTGEPYIYHSDSVTPINSYSN